MICDQICITNVYLYSSDEIRLFDRPGTGDPQMVLFLRPQGTVLLRKPYYLGTDLVLKSRYMTFGFSKYTFLLIFKLFWVLKPKKWLFGFILKCLLSYLTQILISLQDFRQFLTYKSIYCIIFGYTFLDFCDNHQQTNCEMLKKKIYPNKIWEQPYYLVLFENLTKAGTVLSETVLSGDSL
jgi:hypothetical protein